MALWSSVGGMGLLGMEGGVAVGDALTSQAPGPLAGVVRTAVANLDRETQDRYEVVVRATDMAGQLGGLSGSTTVTIVITDVNDSPPRFPQSKASAWDLGGEGGCPGGRMTTAELGSGCGGVGCCCH